MVDAPCFELLRLSLGFACVVRPSLGPMNLRAKRQTQNDKQISTFSSRTAVRSRSAAARQNRFPPNLALIRAVPKIVREAVMEFRVRRNELLSNG